MDFFNQKLKTPQNVLRKLVNKGLEMCVNVLKNEAFNFTMSVTLIVQNIIIILLCLLRTNLLKPWKEYKDYPVHLPQLPLLEHVEEVTVSDFSFTFLNFAFR